MKRIALGLGLLFGKYIIKNNDIVNTRTGNVIYISANKFYLVRNKAHTDIIKLK